MILTDEEVEARLIHPDNLLNKIKVIQKEQNLKSEGDTKIPPMVRGLIASLAVQSSESDSKIGSIFGVSQPTVSNAARGMIGDRVDEDLQDTVKQAKTGIKAKTDLAHEAALDNLVESLSLANPLLVGLTDVKELTRTARDMSAVVANLKRSKDEASNTTNNTLVVLHSAGNVRKESQYEAIDV